jgi:hypothetical protein
MMPVSQPQRGQAANTHPLKLSSPAAVQAGGHFFTGSGLPADSDWFRLEASVQPWRDREIGLDR